MSDYMLPGQRERRKVLGIERIAEELAMLNAQLGEVCFHLGKLNEHVARLGLVRPDGAPGAAAPPGRQETRST